MAIFNSYVSLPEGRSLALSVHGTYELGGITIVMISMMHGSQKEMKSDRAEIVK